MSTPTLPTAAVAHSPEFALVDATRALDQVRTSLDALTSARSLSRYQAQVYGRAESASACIGDAVNLLTQARDDLTVLVDTLTAATRRRVEVRLQSGDAL